MRYDISCDVNTYNAGVVTRYCRIESRVQSYDHELQRHE
jgi:hypothetical protein